MVSMETHYSFNGYALQIPWKPVAVLGENQLHFRWRPVTISIDTCYRFPGNSLRVSETRYHFYRHSLRYLWKLTWVSGEICYGICGNSQQYPWKLPTDFLETRYDIRGNSLWYLWKLTMVSVETTYTALKS